MPKITKICVQSNNADRCNVYLDDQFAFALSAETVYVKRLKKGQELSESEILELTLDGEKSKALSKATDYVCRYSKTKKQVKDYLVGKGYSNNVVFYVLERLEKYGYIDDKSFSKRFIEANGKNCGKKMLYYKLMQKGVKKSDIDEVFNDFDGDLRENAVELAYKYVKHKEFNSQTITKLYRYLGGRGFSYEEIEYAVGCVKDGELE